MSSKPSVVKPPYESKISSNKFISSKYKWSSKRQFLTSKSSHSLISKQPKTTRNLNKEIGNVNAKHRNVGSKGKQHNFNRDNGKCLIFLIYIFDFTI